VVDQADLDGRAGDAQPGQLGFEAAGQGGRVGRGADDQDLGPAGVWRPWTSAISWWAEPQGHGLSRNVTWSVSSKRISGRVGLATAVT
jgi:hypothetical protein